ncbi:general secretion pathway protein E [Selenomonas ruminantium]|uniref:General secretion pathway protein E n=1 Tax=Selenomonas ruminantium TaxID=971 RepID=A0A1I3DG85_SELRU|nr:GspE/PulE family protein [Selenomonas ruminantium]SFH85792.1 general secretion pathway protein E [Selenomonas ruminantium]
MLAAEENWNWLIGQALREVRQGNVAAGRSSAVVRLADWLLDRSISQRASDLHLEPLATGMRLRYRIDGILQQAAEQIPLELTAPLLSRLKVMAGMDIAQHQRPQDGHIRYDDGRGAGLDIRVSVMPVLHGEMMVLRFMDLDEQLLRVAELGFSLANQQKFEQLIHRPAGLLVIAGPMGAGKTTTLYAALSELNQPECSLLTLEDPVERELPGVNQVQINPKAGLDYVTGLKAALRQDTQVVLLSEIRDAEAAEMAVRIGLTGHQVMTTLHTETAAAVIFRLLEMGIAPYLLAATLSGIVAQRLVRRICPHCREEYQPEPEAPETLLLGKRYRRGETLWRGRGCAACGGTGYRGRLALHEILLIDSAVRQAILQTGSRQEIERLALQQGMQTLWQDGVVKAEQGLTTLAEVKRVLYG